MREKGDPSIPGVSLDGIGLKEAGLKTVLSFRQAGFDATGRQPSQYT